MTSPVHRLVTLDSALARRRFLLIAAASAGSILAGLAGCAAPSGRAGASTDASSPPAAEPQRMRGEAARRGPGDPQRARAALADLAVLAAAAERVDGYRLTMPKFEISSAPDAKAVANELGIVDIFIEQVADLTGIGPDDLYAQAFVHKAVIKVDENGTEAAAATGMVIAATSAPAEPRELVVDRPFLFWISESTTGAPLFPVRSPIPQPDRAAGVGHPRDAALDIFSRSGRRTHPASCRSPSGSPG